jgi:hypothetical protein
VIEVELPDGRIIEVDAPDAQSAAAAASKFMRGSAPQQAAPAAPQEAPFTVPPVPAPDQNLRNEPAPPEPTKLEQYARSFGIGSQGAGAGVAEFAALPLDLVAGGQNLLATGINKAFGTSIPMATPASEMIKGGASALATAAGVPVVQQDDMSTPEKYAYNINRFGTQAAGAIPLLASRAATRGAEIAAGSGPKMLDSLVRPYAGENIGRTVVGDAAAAAGAGTAVTAADEAGYKDNPLVQTLAGMAGGIGGMTAVATGERLARGAASAAGRPFGANIDAPVSGMVNQSLNDAPITYPISDQASRVLQNEAVNPVDAAARIKANAAELRALSPDAPMPSPAALSEDPGLSQLERGINMRAPGPAVARTREFASGVRDTIDKVAPEGADASQLVNRVQSVADARREVAQRGVDQASGQARGVDMARTAEAETEVLPFAGRSVSASQRLDQNIVDKGYIPARTEKNRLYNEGVPPETPVDLSGAATAAGNIATRVEQLPPSFRAAAMDPATLTDMQGAGPTTYDTARQTRMALSEQRANARATGAFTQADNLGDVTRPINQALDEANPAAAANYRDNFAPTYRPGPGDEAAKFTKEIDRDPTRSNTPPSATAGRFLQPGAPEKQQALARMLNAAETPEAGQSAVREYLLSDLATSGVVDQRTGFIRPDRLRQWQNQWGDMTDVAPTIQREVSDMTKRAARGERLAGGLADEVKGAQRNLKQTQDQIDKGALGLVLNSDPDKAVAAVMGRANQSGKLLSELIDVTKADPQARNGLKAAVRDYLVDKATTGASEKLMPGDSRGPVSQAKLSAILKEHEKEMAQVFSPEEMNTLRAGNRALELANIERLRVSSGSDTAEKTSLVNQFLGTGIGKTVEAALRLKYGMLKAGGVISTARRLTSGVTGGPNPDEVVRLVERAAVDPELMTLLLGRKMAVASPAWNAKMQQVLAIGEGARDSGPNREP